MRILFWSEYFWPAIGGAEVLGAGVLRAMRERGHACAVVTEQLPGYEPYDEFAGIPVHRFRFAQALGSRDPRQVLDQRSRLLRLARAFQPDVLWAYSCVSQSFFLLNARDAVTAPVLVTLLNGYPDEAVRPGATLGMLLRDAAWVAACSATVAAWALRQAPEIRPRISVIPNALEEPPILPAPLPFDPPLLLGLGRLIEGKGFDTALDALAMLRDEFPFLRLRMAGDGPARAHLERQATASGLVGAVEFTGWVGPAAVPALLNTATIVVLPSRVFEGITLVALQAAQMARPVIATRSGGLPEVVLDGQTGLLIEPGDAHALARAIALLLRDPDLARRLGQDARRRVGAEFGWKLHVAAYEEIMARLARGAEAGEE